LDEQWPPEIEARHAILSSTNIYFRIEYTELPPSLQAFLPLTGFAHEAGAGVSAISGWRK
jgi:hypothetical protein